jgi:hypothetical protein
LYHDNFLKPLNLAVIWQSGHKQVTLVIRAFVIPVFAYPLFHFSIISINILSAARAEAVAQAQWVARAQFHYPIILTPGTTN